MLFVHGGKRPFNVALKTVAKDRYPGHTARPTDFCWAPGEAESWTAGSTSEDNIISAWSPSMRIWAGEEVKVDAEQLEAMDTGS